MRANPVTFALISTAIGLAAFIANVALTDRTILVAGRQTEVVRAAEDQPSITVLLPAIWRFDSYDPLGPTPTPTQSSGASTPTATVEPSKPVTTPTATSDF